MFIASAGHSGSTMLDMLLGAHSDVESLGEITYLPKNLALGEVCGCGDPVPQCPFWGQVLNELGKYLGRDLREDPYALNLGYLDARNVVDRSYQNASYSAERELRHGLRYLQLRFGVEAIAPLVKPVEEAIDNNFRLYDCVSSLTGHSTIVDSTKPYLKAAGLYRRAPADVRIIQLVRDGRGVFYSGLKRGLSRSDAINAWRRHYSRAEPIYARIVAGEHLIRVRYEDLVQSAAGELEKICSFLEIPFEQGMADPRFVAASKQHTINGNNMKHSFREFIFDDAWSRELGDDDLRFFERNAGALNRRLGYR